MHAQLLHLFVTHKGGTDVTAGNAERHAPRRRAGPRARTNNTRTGAHEQGPKQPVTTRNTQRARGRRKQTKQHTQHPTALSATKQKHETTPCHQGKKQQVYALALVCYKETRWLGMLKQAGTRAQNHQKYHNKRQANNATRAVNGNKTHTHIHIHPNRPRRLLEFS